MFCISSKTTTENDNRFYYFVMEKIKNKCIEDKYFKGLNDRCIYEIDYTTKYSSKINGPKIKKFVKYMKLNIPTKIEMYIYPSLEIGLSSTVKKEKFRFSKEATEMDKYNKCRCHQRNNKTINFFTKYLEKIFQNGEKSLKKFFFLDTYISLYIFPKGFPMFDTVLCQN